MQRWLAFLKNHREVMAAFLFTVPTLSFGVLYCFFVIEDHRRRILHFNTTAHPTSEWILQQLREALPLPCHSATSPLIVTGNSVPRCVRS